MKPENTRLILVGLLAATLAGCGGRSDSAPAPQPQQMMVQRQEDALGTGFGVAFRVDANGVPIVPQDSDVNPVSLTADPVALK
jgi:hypothetical protein